MSGIPSATPDAPVFKRPFARPPSRQTKAPTQRASAPSINKEDDALGSLDGFRTASRASSRAGSRAGFYEHDPEPEIAVDVVVETDHVAKKKSRPSLSERTIESLSQLPSSPAVAKGRRRSSFFNADNSMRPPLRPASAMSSNGSRPTTSDGTARAVPATPKRFGTAGRLSMTAPRRSVSASVSTPAATPSKSASIARPSSTAKKLPLSQTQNVQNTAKPRPLVTSKSMVARTPKTRPSLAGVFGQAVSPLGVSEIAPITPSPSREAIVKKTPVTSRKVSSSSIALREQIAKAKAGRQAESTDKSVHPSPKIESSSNALREHIARAKEAARTIVNPSRTSTPPRDAIVPDPAEIAGFDFGLDDPFNQATKGSKSVLRRRLDSARADGRLNIAAMGLEEMPEDVLNMYKFDPDNATMAWGEIVDLTSIIAADNELETLPETMFPDVEMERAFESDEAGPQFAAVQNVDLHGNALRELPVGLGCLTQLSKLNLVWRALQKIQSCSRALANFSQSRNKLTVDVFGVISRIFSLRELRLAENSLEAALPASISALAALEVLDLQTNKLTSLPIEVRLLTSLRILNVSSNHLRDIPAELFDTKLLELQAARNRLGGSLFKSGVVPYLQELNVSNNALTRFCDRESIDLPALRVLNLSTNRLEVLPTMDTWVNLRTLLVAENKLTTLPPSIYALRLHTLDITANDITILDERMALMPLEKLIVAANPLRERKFLTMSPEDIQRVLASRLTVEESATVDGGPVSVHENASTMDKDGWQITPAGILDLSSQGLTKTLDEASLEASAAEIRHFNLQNNAFEFIPGALSLLTHLTVLDLSKNNITTALSSALDLPKLRELRLTANKLTSLTTLTTHLTAPTLQTLDVSNNRLSGSLPILRSFYPALISLIACDNRISEVGVEALTGLRSVNLSNNDIERLEPKIGLLAGTLTALNVEGNKFRVPSYHVLQRGTDTALAWLRDKVPLEDVPASDADAEEM